MKRALAEHPSQWHREMRPRCPASSVQVSDETGNEWWNVFNSPSLGISVRSQEHVRKASARAGAAPAAEE